jgi:hypothetical protein
LVMCLLTLCLLYWKHPLFVFENIARQTESLYINGMIVTELDRYFYFWIPRISRAFYYLLDIVFSGSMLFYFTRPKVKEQFS